MEAVPAMATRLAGDTGWTKTLLGKGQTRLWATSDFLSYYGKNYTIIDVSSNIIMYSFVLNLN